MRRLLFLATWVMGAACCQPALACRMYSPIVLEDVQYADVVLVGRITDYRIIRDEAFRRRMLSNPNLSPELRRIYGSGESLLSDYARFEVEVDDVLKGAAPNRLTVTWDNSTFGEPDQLPSGPFVMALRRPSSEAPPLRGPSATFFSNPEPDLFTVLQAPCSSPFLFESASDEAASVRRLVAGQASTGEVAAHSKRRFSASVNNVTLQAWPLTEGTMFFGVSTLQSVHVLISFAAIASGLWVLGGMVRGRRMDRATLLFLATTLVTTLSGFLLPIRGLTPAVVTGIVSLAVLAVALWARYRARLKGRWRGAYVVTAVIALWLNVFVLIAQLFLKVPALKALAPTGTEPPFGIAQGVTLLVFVALGVLAFRRFRV